MKFVQQLGLITGLSFFCYLGYAQSPINIGIKAGVSTNKYIDNIDSLVQDNSIGWQGGFMTRVNIKKLCIEGNVLLNSKPGSFTSKSGITSGEIEIYGVDIPITLGYKPIKTPVFNARVFGGPVAHYNFYDKVKTQFANGELKTNSNWHFKGGPQWSATAGAGIDVLVFTLDVSYI
jgi:hypothetical protein